VTNAFLHGELAERVYCYQPAGFVDPGRPDHVCLLSKSLYGLRQAPRAWFDRLCTYLLHIGFRATGSDASLFVFNHATDTAFLVVHVDDIIITTSSQHLLRRIVDQLRAEFAIKDIGDVRFFLGVQVTRNTSGFFLNQSQYAEDVLERADMLNCKPASTPADTKPKLSLHDDHPLSDKGASFYRSIAGALQYLTLTCPDVAYVVNQACLYMHAPHDSHWNLIKRILRYLRDTLHQGITISPSSTMQLTAYSDADWAGCPDTRRSTSRYRVFLRDSLVSWSSKRQMTVSRSSAEAEYHGVTHTAAECCWLCNLLGELLVEVPKATIIYCDSVLAVYLSKNPVPHRRTKHVEFDIYFVRERVAVGQLRILQVPSSQQYADIMTKGLPTPLFEEFKTSLCIRTSDAATAGGGGGGGGRGGT
jgi:hypothetical protein